MLGLILPRVSSRVSGFPVAPSCLWGKLQNLSFSKVSKQVVMSFCVAGAALCDIPTCFLFDNVSKIMFCGRRITIASFSQDELQFSWQAKNFGDLCRHFAWHAQHFKRVALRALHSTLYTPPFTLHSPHFTFHTLHSTLYTPHFTLHTLHSTLTLYALHSTLHTLHSTLFTPHSTLYTLHFTHSTLYTPHSTLSTPHSTLYTLHFTLYTLHSTLYTLHSHSLHCICTLHFTLDTLHCTLHTPQLARHFLPYSIVYGALYSMVTRENVQDCSNKLFQKCSTWLHIHVFQHLYHEHTCEHSGSWAASCCVHLVMWKKPRICLPYPQYYKVKSGVIWGDHVPVVPHKAVAEVSKIGNL